MSKKPLATVAGAPDKPLIIGDIEIPCYVLEDEMRVLAQRGMIHGLDMSRGSAGGGVGVDRLAAFVGGNAIKPYVSKGIMDAIKKPIIFTSPHGGGDAYGYPATLLADICDAVIEARNDKALLRQQIHIAKRCEILMRGFARIGIIGLVDEATGYQEIRAKNALVKILEAYLDDELQKWTKTFTDEFYREIFKLKGWDWKEGTVKKPSVIGHYTNDIVYNRLAPGVLDELKQRNPTNAQGHRLNRHHQWFTPDFGHPKLKEHLAAVIALMKAAPNWDAFQRSLQRAFPKPKDQGTLDIDDD